jgi:sugar-phosphatase
MVTSTDVSHGKPNPEPFLKAAAKLGFPASECIVVEDVAAGVRAGKSAGARVMSLRTTIRDSDLRDAGADFILDNCADISLVLSSDSLQLCLKGANKQIANPALP